MKNILVLLSIFVLLTANTSSAFAASPRPSQSPAPVLRHAPAKFKRVEAEASFSEFKNSVRIHLVNSRDVEFINYTLTYTHNGIDEGVVGTFTPNDINTINETIFLGTCSQNSCTPHENPTNIKLELIGEYENGRPIDITLNIAS